MNIRRLLILFFIIGCLLNACMPDLIENELPDLDDYEIVFQSLESDLEALTFYNIETKKTYDLVFTREVTRPIVSRSERVIPLLHTSNNFAGLIDLETERLKSCSGWPNYWIAADPQAHSPYDIILATTSNVYRYDLKNCEISEMLFDMDNYRDIVKFDGGLKGFSITPDGKQLYIGEAGWDSPTKYTLFILELEDGELFKIGVGISPSVSNSGTLLAYFSYDGLYLLDLTSQITEKLLDFPKPNTVYPPQIFWSADDKEMLFHFEPQRKEGSLFDDLEIVVFNLEKKEKTILPVKGLYPSWIQE